MGIFPKPSFYSLKIHDAVLKYELNNFISSNSLLFYLKKCIFIITQTRNLKKKNELMRLIDFNFTDNF